MAEYKPWLPDEAIAKLETVIDRSSWVIEHGSGYSTIWLAKRVDLLISYESDPKWYTKIGGLLYKEQLIDHVRLFYATNIAEKGVYLPKDAPRGPVYDLISVDGRGRTKFWESMERNLKPGGYVLFDDAERIQYWNSTRPIMETYEDVNRYYKPEKPQAYTLIARKPNG